MKNEVQKQSRTALALFLITGIPAISILKNLEIELSAKLIVTAAVVAVLLVILLIAVIIFIKTIE